MILKYRIILLGLVFCVTGLAQAQERNAPANKFSDWWQAQTIPSLSWTSRYGATNFSFEWEVTPVLYSFGIAKQARSWYFFIVDQQARSFGSVEINISGQISPSKITSTHFGWSAQLLGHLPIIEYGEYLGMNIGVARYMIGSLSSNYIVTGVWTMFGFFHLNFKYSPVENVRIYSFEIRAF
jgi:hypothetical protein